MFVQSLRRPLGHVRGSCRCPINVDESDEVKLAALERSVCVSSAEYGFRSFDVGTIGISRDNDLPTREGFDLGFVTSASDAIHIVWAYRRGLLEGRTGSRQNHPGLLMFDEPRQQAADPLSFQALLRRAAQDSRWSADSVCDKRAGGFSP